MVIGNINIYNASDVLVHTFQCGVSPGTIVFDIRNMTSVTYINHSKPNEEGLLYDLNGRNVRNASTFLRGGFYINKNKLFLKY